MSNSKPLPPCTFDVLCYLNRDQLERFTIVCRPLKNVIERYFRSKPYRIFDQLYIRGRLLYRYGSYALRNNSVQWHPNRDDYSVQQFLAGQKCSIDDSKFILDDPTYYSFAEMRLYLGPTVRIRETILYVTGRSTSPDIANMESIAYLWREAEINIFDAFYNRIDVRDFESILNSPTILQCRKLNILFRQKGNDPSYWTEFLEQPGVKPIVSLQYARHEEIVTAVKCLKKAISNAVSPNAFKLVLATFPGKYLTEFREMNSISHEKLVLRKAFSTEIKGPHMLDSNHHALERSNV